MKSRFFWRFGIRLIILGIFLIIAFFAAAFESLSVAGRYTDLTELKSETLKDGGHYGGFITSVYGNYAEEGYSLEGSDDVVSAYEQYYITDVQIEDTDKWMYVSISLRDDENIRQADNLIDYLYGGEENADNYFEFSGICEPLDPELKAYLLEFTELSSEEFDELFVPYNIRQVDAQGNGTILTIGIIVIIIFGVIITVLVKKAKQKKLEGDGTVFMDLPPEIAEAVKRNSGAAPAGSTADGFTSAPDPLPDMSNIKQPDTDSFFADLDRKRGSPRGQVAGEATPNGDNRTASVNTTPAPKPSPFAGVNENAEMDELLIPEDTGDDVGADTIRPQNTDTEEATPVSTVGEISAEDYLNKDFISQ
jgi:hypothetical protein